MPAAAKPRRGSGKDAGAALGWGSDFGLSCRTLSAAPAGFQLLAQRSRAVPVPPHPPSRLGVPCGDKNTSPAAPHLVLETSLGNSNKKLKIKGPKERDRRLAAEVRELKIAVM